MAQRSADEITQRIRRPHIVPRASSVIVDPALEAHATSRMAAVEISVLVSERPTRRLLEHEVLELVNDLAEDHGARLAHTLRRTPAGGTPTVPMPTVSHSIAAEASCELAAGSVPEMPQLATGTSEMPRLGEIPASARSPRWHDVAIGFAIGVGMIGAAMIGLFA